MWAKSFIEELKKLAFDSSFGAMREVSRDDPALIDEVKGDSTKININPKKAPVKKHTKEQKELRPDPPRADPDLHSLPGPPELWRDVFSPFSGTSATESYFLRPFLEGHCPTSTSKP